MSSADATKGYLIVLRRSLDSEAVFLWRVSLGTTIHRAGALLSYFITVSTCVGEYFFGMLPKASSSDGGGHGH